MILYMCRYAPAEVLEAMGAKTEYLESEGGDLSNADSCLHPAVCSFTKAAFEEIMSRKDLDGVLFTGCCDSTRRHFDVLRRLLPGKFIHMAELPVFQGNDALSLYTASVRKLIDAYEAFGGHSFNASALLEIMRSEQTPCRPGEGEDGSGEVAGDDISDGIGDGAIGLRIGLAGAKFPPSLRALAEAAGMRIVFDATCSGQKNKFYITPREDAPEDEILSSYVNGVFSKFPCMRMVAGDERREGLGRMARTAKADGLIYHTIKFCDNYAYEYAGLLAGGPREPSTHTSTTQEPSPWPGLPMLRIETDYTAGAGGQFSTRFEAFAEQLRARKSGRGINDGGCAPAAGGVKGAKEGEMGKAMENAAGSTVGSGAAGSTVGSGAVGSTVGSGAAGSTVGGGAAGSKAAAYTMGIDSGSTSTNAVIIGGALGMIASSTMPTGALPRQSAQAAAALAIERAGLRPEDIGFTVATGYGRAFIEGADKSVTEITCHARGAHRLYPGVCSVIDIGGQDSKVIRVSATGGVEDFAMNDKCAAGTGRFLEKTSGSLGVPLEAIGDAAAAAGETLTISSMCTVFAESEVVSLVAEGKSVESILRGLCFAIASRNKALFTRAGARPPYMMTGGVARNRGVVAALEEILGEPVFVPGEPELAGALGAAIIAAGYL